MINNNSKIVDWLKTQIDKKFAKDLGYKEIKVYFSCDRPYPDLIAECKKDDDKIDIIRFLVI